jgi:chaperone BCS1
MKVFNGAGSPPVQPIPSHQISIIDVFIPGFSSISATMQQVLAGNMDSYARLLCIVGVLVFLVRYAYRYVKELVETYFSL